MSRTTRIIVELASIAVAIWFLVSPGFADMPAKRILDAIAFVVIGLSLWRLLKLWKAR
ncbi:hypothetical protein [Jannaschia formosa]|uniref:hypothetical protein n=1 Tax=Jannaschia formosa TaxID=2259592 RepID=UPI001430713E|nr:hypothetical protein [Jannaschia formosa]